VFIIYFCIDAEIVGRVAHKTGNYLLNDVYIYIYIYKITESNLYSGFPIMQFISLETGLA